MVNYLSSYPVAITFLQYKNVSKNDASHNTIDDKIATNIYSYVTFWPRYRLSFDKDTHF